MADYAVQLLLGQAWTTVPVLAKSGVTITRGRQSRSGRMDYGRCNVTIRNDGGDFTARNPRSPYREFLGKGVQLRVNVPDQKHMYSPGFGALATTPDHSSLDVTGDLDLRADLQADSFVTDGQLGIADKWLTTGNNRSWIWHWTQNGRLRFRWSPDGTFPNSLFVTSTEPVPVPADGRVRVRVTLRPNVGGLWEVRFYTATSMSLPWTQLGDFWFGPAVGGAFAGTGPIRVGQEFVFTDMREYTCRVYSFQMRAGVDGTVVAAPDFTAPATGASTFSDSTGKLWTVAGGAQLRDFDVRYHGEVAKWPPRSNVSGAHLTMSLEAAGLLRRLSRPKAALVSALYREATKAANRAALVAYWACEEPAGSTRIASAIGGTAMTLAAFGAADVRFAEDTASFPGSAPLPVITATALSGFVPAHTSTGTYAWRALINVPSAGWADNTAVAEISQRGSSTIQAWRVVYGTGGTLRLVAIGLEGSVVADSGPIGFAVNGQRQMIGLNIRQVGSTVEWDLLTKIVHPDLHVTETASSGVFNAVSVGTAFGVLLGGNLQLTDATIGHIMLGTSTDLGNNLLGALVGHAGETAAARIRRICAELGVALRIIGDPTASTPMGPQPVSRQLDVLDACAKADGGQLGEARDALALVYRTRISVYSQTPRVRLAYGQRGESPVLEPEDVADDVVNDITIKRSGGSSARAVDETSRLSVQDYPNGVGRYEAEETLDVATDSLLDDIARWELLHGTWDEYKYPKIEIDIGKLSRVGKTALAVAATRLDLMDRITITEPPEWLPPQAIDQIAQGYTEVLRPGVRMLSCWCTPAGPWEVGVWGRSRRDARTTTLAAAVDEDGVLWPISTDLLDETWSTAGGYVWGVDGEELLVLSVTAPTGSGPYLQTATVQRGTHYRASHPAGTPIHLRDRPRWGRR